MHNQEIQTYHEDENQKDDCCSDEFELIEGQDHLKIQLTETELSHPIFVTAFIQAFIFQLSVESQDKPLVYIFPPPLIQQDFQAFYQVYLI